MSVDLSDLIDTLKREVAPPGSEDLIFPDATDDAWLGHLEDAFWEARLDGMLKGFDEIDGLVNPVDPLAADLTRDLQQLVVFYAGMRIVRTQLTNLKTLFRAKAGPVEYETQQSAQLLQAVLKELQSKRDIVLVRLSDVGLVPSYYIDAVLARNDAIQFHVTDWVGY